jgi:hypothetical protein
MLGAGFNVFALWGYAIANAKPPDGVVELNPKLLAVLLGGDEQSINNAIEYLLRPDPYSRNKEADGRRIIKIGQYDYRLVNFPKHRLEGADEEERKRYHREKQRIYRKSNNVKRNVSYSIGQSLTIPQAEAEAEAEAEGEKKPPPSLSEQIRKDRSFGKCCTRCGSSSKADSGRMVWRESLPWCSVACYNIWVKS